METMALGKVAHQPESNKDQTWDWSQLRGSRIPHGDPQAATNIQWDSAPLHLTVGVVSHGDRHRSIPLYAWLFSCMGSHRHANGRPSNSSFLWDPNTNVRLVLLTDPWTTYSRARLGVGLSSCFLLHQPAAVINSSRCRVKTEVVALSSASGIYHNPQGVSPQAPHMRFSMQENL